MSTTISRKHYTWMRALGITAMVCVFLLFTFIMVESSLDTNTSAALTQNFYDLFRPVKISSTQAFVSSLQLKRAR